ncbi:unnamed protein product [Amaranthus hypochondriacus]
MLNTNFFTSFELKEFIKVAESLAFVHQGSLGPAKGETYRDNDRISVNDPNLANVVTHFTFDVSASQKGSGRCIRMV